jgi:hypothetical protein
MQLGGTESNKETLGVKINMSQEGEKYNIYFFFGGGAGRVLFSGQHVGPYSPISSGGQVTFKK